MFTILLVREVASRLRRELLVERSEERKMLRRVSGRQPPVGLAAPARGRGRDREDCFARRSSCARPRCWPGRRRRSGHGIGAPVPVWGRAPSAGAARLNAPETRRVRLFSGRAALGAQAMLGLQAEQAPGEATFAIVHGLYWLVATLAELQPLALLIETAVGRRALAALPRLSGSATRWLARDRNRFG